MIAEGADHLLLSLLPLARARAYAPLSGFQVGAVVQGGSGSVYLGANIEVPGHSLGLTVHAEQAALANAYMAGEDRICVIAVTAAPCGHCRQFLKEMVPDGDVRVLIQGAASTSLSALLPQSFGPADLGFERGALPIRESELSLIVDTRDPLVLAALEAARRSYAPYTSSYSGVALLTSDGRTVTGSYIENAAFNPSLSPAHTALAGLGGSPASVKRVVLVEVEAAKISQESFVRAVVSSAQIEVVKAKRVI
ncbi:MAG: cytidine deaminase [Bryobacteraceae bacterium]